MALNVVGLALVAAALGLVGYKATTDDPMCTGSTSDMLCAAQYLAVLAVLGLWVASVSCTSPTATALLTALADLVLLGVVVTIVNTDPESFVDVDNPQRIAGNALIVLVAIWRISVRVNEFLAPRQSYYAY